MNSLQQRVNFGSEIGDLAIIKQSYVARVIEYQLQFAADASKMQVDQLSTMIGNFCAPQQIVFGHFDELSHKRQVSIKGSLLVTYISQPMAARISR